MAINHAVTAPPLPPQLDWPLARGKKIMKSLLANVIKRDPILEMYRFPTHFDTPEVNFRTSAL